MNSEAPSIEISQNFTSASVIPSMVEDWCRNSEQLQRPVAEVYAVNFASTSISSSSVFEPYELAGITEDVHLKSSEDSPLVLG